MLPDDVHNGPESELIAYLFNIDATHADARPTGSFTITSKDRVRTKDVRWMVEQGYLQPDHSPSPTDERVPTHERIVSLCEELEQEYYNTLFTYGFTLRVNGARSSTQTELEIARLDVKTISGAVTEIPREMRTTLADTFGSSGRSDVFGIRYMHTDRCLLEWKTHAVA